MCNNYRFEEEENNKIFKKDVIDSNPGNLLVVDLYNEEEDIDIEIQHSEIPGEVLDGFSTEDNKKIIKGG